MLFDRLNQPAFAFIALAVLSTLILLTVFVVSIAKFYRRCGPDEALVRTGAGGTKVVIGGGVNVYPILHQLMRVSLRSIKLQVERSSHNALVTKDKIRANVTTELYIKVEPLHEDVLAAARSFGERNLEPRIISELIDGKLTDALRSVAANQTFMDLHGKRKEFAEHIQGALSEELKKNGLTLENVSITALAMVPVKELDGSDVFDAEGLRAITESVQSNAEKTNSVRRETEVAIQNQDVTARKRSLELAEAQKRAEAEQAQRVIAYEAARRKTELEAQIAVQKAQEACEIDRQKTIETARLVAEREITTTNIEKQKVLQVAEIERERTIEAASIEKQKITMAAEIEKEKAIETARISKQIAILETEEREARTAAQKAEAEAEREQKAQAIITVQETARANREKQTAIIKAEEGAQGARIAAEQDAFKVKLDAETAAAAVLAQAQSEASAIVTLAEANRQKGEAEAVARRLAVEAENRVDPKLLLRDVTLKALEVLPAVTRELMAPARAIGEIKILQLQGGPAGARASGETGSTNGPLGIASPVLSTILEAGAAYPLLKELLGFAQVDPGQLADKARTALGELPAALRDAVSNGTAPTTSSASNGETTQASVG
jgi:uncharacterized membrane protein YqiK